MLIASVLAIVGLSVFPDARPMQMKRVMKSIQSENIIAADTTNKQPIVIQIISEPKPYDWKGTISWVIGGINGMVLLIMNVKNIRKK